MTLVLGIDIGTSGIRTAVLDEEGNVLSMARAEHIAQAPDEIDAQNWWKAVRTCLCRQAQALSKTGRASAEITRIAVDGTSGSMTLTNAALTPLCPALMYNSKGFEAEAHRIAQHAPESHITQGANSALARAMHLVSMAGEKPAHLLHQADFIAAKLIGRGGFSDPNNALKTGYDPSGQAWPEWLEALINPALLPKIMPVGAEFGPVQKTIREEFGLSPQAVVCAGTTDSIAAFLACGPLETGIAVTSLGSTLAVKMLCPIRIDDPEIGLYSHRLGDLWLAGGASNTGGAVLGEYFTPLQIEALSAQIDPDKPTGLAYYPLSRPGERFPINDPYLPGKMTPRPAEDHKFLQAMFEGIAAIEAKCYRIIEARAGIFPKTILTAGGGAKNDVWARIRAHALGLSPQRAQHSEAAIGTARIAARSAI